MTSRPNMGVLAAVAAIALIAAVAAVVIADREPADTEPGTPEATVQEYLQAVFDGDPAAVESLEPDTACDADDVARAPTGDASRAVLVGSRVDGDTAIVRVEITESSSDSPFDASGFRHVEVFDLARQAGEWHITGTAWPLFGCDRSDG